MSFIGMLRRRLRIPGAPTESIQTKMPSQEGVVGQERASGLIPSEGVSTAADVPDQPRIVRVEGMSRLRSEPGSTSGENKA